MARPIIRTPDEVLGPGIDALVALRPRALSFCNYPTTGGTYAKVFAGWRAQIALCLRRQAAEAAAARLPFAKGAELLDLASDEYFTQPNTQATTAIGQLLLVRGAGRPGGAIRKGTRFRRDADDTQIPAVQTASFEVIEDVPVNQGATTALVNLRAQRAGSYANAPTVNGAVQGTLQIADTLFDPTFIATNYSASGGSDGAPDDLVRREAQANSVGQYAPTRDAIIAGALQGYGVRHAAIFDVASVTSSQTGPPGFIPPILPAAFTSLVIADQSWSGNAYWASLVQQGIAGSFAQDAYLGFGCTLRITFPSCIPITVQTTVLLRDVAYLSFTSDIDAKIQAAVVDYFDNRPDWYTFRASQLRAVVSRADRRILTCTSVSILNQSTGAAITDPAQPVFYATGPFLTHWIVGEGACANSYAVPT